VAVRWVLVEQQKKFFLDHLGGDSIAWAIAQAASREGASLVLTYQERFEEHVKELARSYGFDIVGPPLD
jgi:enoyl-[acyl-carrier-protein] reductase (NADH)